MFNKKRVIALLAEFVGTYVLGSVVLAVLTRSSLPFFAAVAAGITLAALVLTLGPVSGAHLNPAVTVGLLSLRKISIPISATYLIAQVAGGYAALQVNSYLLNSTVQNLADKSWNWRIVIAEGLGAVVFTLGVAAALSRSHDKSARAAIIGASLFIGILIASFSSAGMVNPAVAVATGNVSLGYLVAPLFGGVIGMNVYKYAFALPEARAVRK
jgi:glycerol uptake facilitator-like aquaporin